MKDIYLFLTAALLFIMAPIGAVPHVLNKPEKPKYLFVMSGKTGSLEEGKLTLNDVPVVVYFSDRPNRVAGHIKLRKFLELWGKGSNNFKSDPPNATLSILEGKAVNSVIIDLQNPEIRGRSISFNTKVLENHIPSTFGVSSLFFDDIESSDSIENLF